MLPKISIVTPSFNQVSYIEQTIDSVLSQDYPNLEYMVMDGGSTDGSVEIIKKYEKHLAYWESRKDAGQSDAINKGIRRASGEIINWLNSDDYYQPGALFKVAKAFNDPKVRLYSGRSNIVDGAGKWIRSSSGTDIYSGNLAKTIGQARIDQPETFYRSSAVYKIGLLNTHLQYVMDKDWWIKYLLIFGLGGIRIGKDALVNFRFHGQSKSSMHQNSFEIETNTLYYHLCESNGLTKYKDIITSTGINPHLDISYTQHNEADLIIQYYLLYKADRAYYLGDHKLSQNFLAHIHPQSLSPEDRSLYHKLKLRSKLIPGWLRKAAKSLYA